MARPLRILYPGAFYHVITRGNEKRDIFYDEADYKFFLHKLKEQCLAHEVVVHSYCLMPNHVHLLLETKKANLSYFMKRLLGDYSIKFNKRHERAGHLLQGRYKAFLVDADSYLLELTRYIHLNPCKSGLTKLPDQYKWSSMSYFLNDSKSLFLNKSRIMSKFKDSLDYYNFVLSGLKEEIDLNKHIIGGLVLGSKEFTNSILSKFSSMKFSNVSKKKELHSIPIDRIVKLASKLDEDPKLYLMWKYGNRTMSELGSIYGKTKSTICYRIKKLKNRIENDKSLKKIISKIELNLQGQF